MIELYLPNGHRLPLDTPKVIGRNPERVGFTPVPIDDPGRSLSKNHALVEPISANEVQVTDLDSTNGTWVTGRGLPPTRAVASMPEVLRVPAQITCGDHEILVITDTAPTASSSSHRRPNTPALSVRSLCVETNGHRRLDGVDLDAFAGEMIGVLGTSGAGKSTLVKAIAGVDPASSGTVTLNGVDVYADFRRVRREIGYVPQDDILHPTLTVRETLDFGARLRLPRTSTVAERAARVTSVLDELGLTPRADARVSELSGGQRKRVNVAIELLTSPRLLILDEPTSGLDPGNERISMELFRSLADEQRVVLVVTHSTESLQLCDRLLLMAASGVKVYDGPPDRLGERFGGRPINEVFALLESSSDVAEFRDAPLGAAATPAAPPPPVEADSLVDRAKSADFAVLGHQLSVLSDRYLRVIKSDKRNSLILASQGVVIAVLMLAVFSADSLAPGPQSSKSGNVLMALTLAAIYLGASNAVREVVKERPILRRELALGVSPVAYLGSKLIPLGSLTIAQAAVLVVVGTARQGVPTGSATFLPAMTEIFLIVATCGVSALCLGLLISATSPSPDRAMTVLPVVLFAQLLLVGLIFPVSTIGVQQIAWLTSAYWGFGGAASTVDFESLYCGLDPDVECASLWSRSAVNWIVSYGILCALATGALFLAWRALDRTDPAQILQRRRLDSGPATDR